MHSQTHSYLVIALIIIASAARMAKGHSTPLPPITKDEAMKLLLVAPKASPVAAAINKLQLMIKDQPADLKKLEKLGQLFITEARVLHDDNRYQLADLCGRVMELDSPELPEALLLRGNALLAMHRFHDAEEVAHVLLKKRQGMMDHALLGDALMEQGRLNESIPEYQAMIDTKPCLPSYSRVAHVRWLKGDIEGAIEMMDQAVACGSYRDPEPMAWCTTRLAFFLAQSGKADVAIKLAERALELMPDYPQALFVIGRAKLAQGDARGAVEALKKGAKQSPLPEMLWALSDAQQLEHDSSQANATMALIKNKGESGDPRSFALFLATQRTDTDHSLDLAKAELSIRQDVFSWDALAWAQFAAGETEAAMISSRKAMSEGTREARLVLHAGLIAQRAGDKQATQWLADARALRALLLPSEQSLLDHSSTSASSVTKSD